MGEFEDQTPTRFELRDGTILLDIACWHEDTDTKTNTSVVFTNISNLQISDNTPQEIKMFGADGDIIHFETNDNHMLLIIIWRYYMPSTTMSVYNFDFESMKIVKKP